MDVYHWLSLCVNGLKISPSEFWNMPFFMVTDQIKRISDNNKREMSRKEILAQMRHTKQKNGWV